MEGREVHCNIIKNGFDLDSGEIFNSELVFGEMVVRNIVSWTALIAGYVQNGFFKKGLGVFREMVALGTQPNAITLMSILPACAGLEFLNLGKLVHGCAVKLGVDSDISLINTLITLYGKCGIIDTARSLFDQMLVQSLVSWNAMIAAYEQTNADRYAIKLFRRMLIEKVEFDYITMVSVISACANLGALNIGKWIHKLVRNKGLETNVSITNALIDMYAKCGNIDLARDAFDRGMCISWAWGQCFDAFTKMKEEGIRPNSFTFISVLTACRHSELANLVEAYEFIENMPSGPDIGVWGAFLVLVESMLEPQTVSFYVLMTNIYVEAGRWEDVARLRKLMEERELKKILGHSLVLCPGSSLGLSYWSSLSNSNSFLPFANSRVQNENANVSFNLRSRGRSRLTLASVVFEYFASIRTPSGEVLMTPGDLMCVVVPVFPPSESNRIGEGYLKGEWIHSELHCAPSIFFMLFDTDNDGLISFAEEIDKDEFKKVMTLMRSHNRQGARHRDGLRIGLKVSGSVEDGGLLEYFFGKDGKQCLEHGKFVQFLRDLHDEILWLEFAHYDYKSQGTISAKDFALSRVASADMRHVNKFLDRVEELNDEPNLKDIRITFEEFKNLAELRKRLCPLSLAIFSHGKVNGLLTKPDFQRATYHIIKMDPKKGPIGCTAVAAVQPRKQPPQFH
ncbi:hypothetical protein ACSBR2_025598 [Camellia fascicularis]